MGHVTGNKCTFFSCLLYAPASSGLTLQLRQHNPHPWPAQEGKGCSRTHWEGDAPFPELSAHKPVSRGVVRRKSCPECGRNGEHRGQEMLQIVMTFIKSLSSLGWIWADRLLWETPHSLLPLPVMDQPAHSTATSTILPPHLPPMPFLQPGGVQNMPHSPWGKPICIWETKRFFPPTQQLFLHAVFTKNWPLISPIYHCHSYLYTATTEQRH